MEPVFIIFGVGIIVLISFLSSRHFDNKRSEAMQTVANTLNFSFVAKGDFTSQPGLDRFQLFSKGRSKRISNVMHGKANDINLTILDYRYTTGGGKNSRTWRQTVMLFQSDLLNLPAFALRPEGMFHKIGKVLGFSDINFDSNPEFSAAYLLKGADETSIRTIFNRNLLSFYERQHKLSTEGDGNLLLFYRSSRRVAPEEIKSFMEEGFTAFSLFKPSS